MRGVKERVLTAEESNRKKVVPRPVSALCLHVGDTCRSIKGEVQMTLSVQSGCLQSVRLYPHLVSRVIVFNKRRTLFPNEKYVSVETSHPVTQHSAHCL